MVRKSFCKTQSLQNGRSWWGLWRKPRPLWEQNTSERACSDKYRARRLRGKELCDATHLGCQIMALSVSLTPMHLFRSSMVETGYVVLEPEQIP